MWPVVMGTFLGEVMPVLVFRAWGYLGKRDAEAEEVGGYEGGVRPWWRGRFKGGLANPLPQLIPSSSAWTTRDCYGWQGVGLRRVLLYLG